MTDQSKTPPQGEKGLDLKALLAEVERSVADKKAQGIYDPAEVRRVEEAQVELVPQAGEDAPDQMSLHHARLQGLWEANLFGVTTHRAGPKGRLIVGAKKFIHKLTRPFLNIWLARQVTFNDELVKLLNLLLPHLAMQHADLRRDLEQTRLDAQERQGRAEKRLDVLEEMGRSLAEIRREVALLQSMAKKSGQGEGKTELLLARLQEILEKQAAAGTVSAETARAVAAERSRSRGAAYLAFEDMHRGSREEIRRRQEVYLPIFKDSVSQEKPLLDLGCGRGEFLELVREAGISAKGVDLNPEMVAACRQAGLDVVEGDAVEFLRGLPEQSLGGIMAAQLIEHLTLDELTELVNLCAAKLAPGGALVAETVNPQCLTTFSGAFYLDLTHQKPIHPEAARFLWRWAGLDQVEIMYLSPYPPEVRLETDTALQGNLAEVFNRNMSRLNDLLYSYQDYAVVGRK